LEAVPSEGGSFLLGGEQVTIRNGNCSKTKKMFIEDFGKRCWLCRKFDNQIELDHIIPLWAGGSNYHENLQLLCIDCHKRKTGIERHAWSLLNPVTIIADGVIQPRIFRNKGKYSKIPASVCKDNQFVSKVKMEIK
jgi:hypothetical protein